MKFTILIVAVFFLTVFSACNSFFNGDQNEKVLAEVGAKKLTLSQLEMAVPSNMEELDSIAFTKKYLEKWVKNQLLLEKAELNLNKEMQKEIEVMIDNYRTSLMLYKYQQILIQQKLDTTITDTELQAYYDKHSENFKLDSSVVKAIFIQIPKSISDRYKVNVLTQSNKEEDMIALEDYCYQKAQTFDMGENWQYFGTILNRIPKQIKEPDQFLKSNKYIEVSDSIYAYYVVIQDYRLSDEITPMIFVKNKIRDIVINHRKVKLIEDLENNIYNDAVDQKKFIIHSN